MSTPAHPSSIKPTGYPFWAGISSSTGLAEPTDAEKGAGWQNNQAPPASYMNWLQEKQNAWIRYLSYDEIILDDFSGGYGTTSFYPWDIVGPAGVTRVPAGSQPGLNGLGVVKLAPIGSSGGVVNSLVREAGGPEQRDVLLEVVCALESRGGSGFRVEAGLRVGAVLAGSEMWFGTTGPSSPWFFNYGPLVGFGAGPTMINLGVDPLSPSRFQTLIAERRGATLTVEVDGQLRAVLGAGGYTYANLPGLAAELLTVNYTGTAVYAVDKFKFGVRR